MCQFTDNKKTMSLVSICSTYLLTGNNELLQSYHAVFVFIHFLWEENRVSEVKYEYETKQV